MYKFTFVFSDTPRAINNILKTGKNCKKMRFTTQPNLSLFWHFFYKMTDIFLSPLNKRSPHISKSSSAFYLDLAKESVKRRFLTPNIPAGKIAHCRGHEAARELQVDFPVST